MIVVEKLRSTACRYVLCCIGITVFTQADDLTWTPGNGFRSAPIQPPSGAGPGFQLIPTVETGIRFTNQLSNSTIATNRLLEIGSGTALGDVDGDGRVDIYFCGLESSNQLYRNLGNWKFADITSESGVACAGQFSTGCVLVDLDADGDLDLLVTSLGGGTRLFRNDGKGRFTEDLQSGLFPRFGATTLALGDVEGDGDLDLYVTNYRTDTFLDQPPGLRTEMKQQADGSWALEPRVRFLTLPMGDAPPLVLERGEPDIFYLNRGGGKFVAAPWETGVYNNPRGEPLKGPPTDWGLAAMFRDINGDGFPDLYVCNDFIQWPDRIWLNEQGRRFKAAPPAAVRSFSVASMAVDFADINRDGIDDFFTVDMLNPNREARARQRPDLLQGKVAWPKHDPDFSPEIARNTLQLGRGDGTFADIAPFAGLAATDWTPSALFLDVDLDGWEDLLTGAGNLHDVQDSDALAAQGNSGRKSRATRLQEVNNLPPRLAPSSAFRNNRDLTFQDVSRDWGFHHNGAVHGFAMADLDNDGDQDLVLNAMNEPARIYRNMGTAPRIAVRLKGQGENSRGAGARMVVRGGPVTQSQEMIIGGRYVSSDDATRTFAAGQARQLEIEVTWRSGRRSLVTNALPNHIYEIQEPGSPPAPRIAPEKPVPLFEDQTTALSHVHTDQLHDDFARRPLLPKKLSTTGPGLSWSDWNKDGNPDLIISTGTGGRPALLVGDGKGGFTPDPAFSGSAPVSRDQSALIPGRDATGERILLVTESTWETDEENLPALRIGKHPGTSNAIAWKDQTPLPNPVNPGALAQADVDGDGDLDLFVAGKFKAGRYPEPGNSMLLLNTTEGFVPSQTFTNLGRINSAVFSDLDGDGDPDLALAADWDTPRILINNNGSYSDQTEQWGLSRLRGWWNGVTSADFDGDGRMDLALSNWGKNWRLDQRTSPEPPVPVLLFYADFTGEGLLETLLASEDRELGKITPWRERKALVSSLPFIALKFPNHKTYSRASIHELLEDSPVKPQSLAASVFENMILLNRGNHFEPKPLPREAQFSAGFGICASDFNGDGNEDLFLAQNFFGTDPETPRQDAGAGLLMIGNGRGEFRPLSVLESGISMSGEQRGNAAADYDGDGRVDIAVGQNAGQTRLYRNKTAKPGLRVILRGSTKNPDAIGASIRLEWTGGAGPARELQSGSGWLSANSPVQVLGYSQQPASVMVRWPGGKTTRSPLSPGQREIQIQAPQE